MSGTAFPNATAATSPINSAGAVPFYDPNAASTKYKATPLQIAQTGAPPVTTVATSGASQAIAFPASGNACYDIALSANCTISLSGGTANQYQTIVLILRQSGGGGFTPTLPAGVKWPGGTAPTPNTVAGKIDVFYLSTSDAGTTVFGSY